MQYHLHATKPDQSLLIQPYNEKPEFHALLAGFRNDLLHSLRKTGKNETSHELALTQANVYL